MQPRKITADYIFDGRRMLTGRMLLTDRDGRVVDLLPLDPGEDVEQHEGILSPGFINCHCHLELSHMKGMIPERTGLADFVFRVVTERHHAEEEITAAIDQAEEEMIRNGIVAVGDICNNILTRPAKQHNRLRYYNFIEASGWLPAVADKRFEHSRRIFDVFSENGTSKHNAIVPHAPYSVSDTLWDRIRPFFRDRVVTIHNQETKYENDFFRDGSGHLNELYRRMGIDNTHHVPTGRTSLQSFFGKLRGASRAILVHNTFTTREDVIATWQAAQNENNGEGKY
ncbi:MAG TPA: amidohydrolase family protein, partial [Flavisolibacter sp.]